MAKPRWMPGWRKLTWVVVLFNILMLLWIIGGSASTTDSCEGEVGTALDACEAGTAIGAGIGVFVLIVLWAFGDVILGVLWMVTRSSKRECPVCGSGVRRGVTVCGSCSYDFAMGRRAVGGDSPAPA